MIKSHILVVTYILCVSIYTEAKIAPKISLSMKPFPLNQMRLLEGPCKEGQQANLNYLLLLDADRLLYSVRVTAGLKPTGIGLGGWEKPDSGHRGNIIGHYLSACALMYASTGNEEIKAKADAIVSEIARCQQIIGTGYIAAQPATELDKLEQGQKRTWICPYYTLHKIMAGLYDMYDLAGNKQALDVLEKLTKYLLGRIDRLNAEEKDNVLKVELGGMSEVLYRLYFETQNSEYKRFAEFFFKSPSEGVRSPFANQTGKESFVESLAAKKEDVLSGIHANTHIPEVIGVALRYELTGRDVYKSIATFFWDRVIHAHSYATGGSQLAECWSKPNELAHTLGKTNQESCTSYNMLKLARHLISWTGDPAYVDEYERIFFNGILGTQNPADGTLIYYTPLATCSVKEWGTHYDSFWCCTGTGMESFSMLANGTYFHDNNNIYVNIFISSILDWEEKHLTLEQRTAFPLEDYTKFIFHTKDSVELALNVHIPYWATNGIEVTVNGKSIPVEPKLTSYFPIERKWFDGDEVEVRMPMSLHIHPMPDDPQMAAIMYGPLVLAGVTYDKPTDLLFGRSEDLNSWIKPVQEKSLSFKVIGQPVDLILLPLNQIVKEKYTVYWRVFDENDPIYQQLLDEEKTRAKAERERKELKTSISKRMVDRVFPNDDISEKEHKLQGERTSSGSSLNGQYRHAAPGGWWSWELTVLPDEAMSLACAYWGGDHDRKFDILIDGEYLAKVHLNNNHPGEIYYEEYNINREMTKDKTKITITFKSRENLMAGGVFDCVILKP